MLFVHYILSVIPLQAAVIAVQRRLVLMPARWPCRILHTQRHTVCIYIYIYEYLYTYVQMSTYIQTSNLVFWCEVAVSYDMFSNDGMGSWTVVNIYYIIITRITITITTTIILIIIMIVIIILLIILLLIIIINTIYIYIFKSHYVFLSEGGTVVQHGFKGLSTIHLFLYVRCYPTILGKKTRKIVLNITCFLRPRLPVSLWSMDLSSSLGSLAFFASWGVS